MSRSAGKLKLYAFSFALQKVIPVQDSKVQLKKNKKTLLLSANLFRVFTVSIRQY